MERGTGTDLGILPGSESPTASRASMADAIEKMLRDDGAKVVRGVGDGKPYAVLLIETPKGERHHLRIIDVSGGEHARFSDA